MVLSPEGGESGPLCLRCKLHLSFGGSSSRIQPWSIVSRTVLVQSIPRTHQSWESDFGTFRSRESSLKSRINFCHLLPHPWGKPPHVWTIVHCLQRIKKRMEQQDTSAKRRGLHATLPFVLDHTCPHHTDHRTSHLLRAQRPETGSSPFGGTVVGCAPDWRAQSSQSGPSHAN